MQSSIKNDEHMRGFLLPLEKSMSYPLFYRISTIKEDDIVDIETSKAKKGGKYDSVSTN